MSANQEDGETPKQAQSNTAAAQGHLDPALSFFVFVFIERQMGQGAHGKDWLLFHV